MWEWKSDDSLIKPQGKCWQMTSRCNKKSEIWKSRTTCHFCAPLKAKQIGWKQRSLKGNRDVFGGLTAPLFRVSDQYNLAKIWKKNPLISHKVNSSSIGQQIAGIDAMMSSFGILCEILHFYLKKFCFWRQEVRQLWSIDCPRGNSLVKKYGAVGCWWEGHANRRISSCNPAENPNLSGSLSLARIIHLRTLLRVFGVSKKLAMFLGCPWFKYMSNSYLFFGNILLTSMKSNFETLEDDIANLWIQGTVGEGRCDETRDVTTSKFWLGDCGKRLPALF